jgi:hypothetical protein
MISIEVNGKHLAVLTLMLTSFDTSSTMKGWVMIFLEESFCGGLMTQVTNSLGKEKSS